MSSPSTAEPVRKSPLERFLGLFADVYGGEGRTVLLMALNIFLILTAYYIIKPVREALILSVPRGAEYKSYAAAGQAILLLLIAVPLYARLASSMPRRRLINTVTLFFVTNLALFYLALKTVGVGTTWLAVAFFLWVGIFNLMVPAQFWSLANDIYNEKQGKRLFAIVGFGASVGAAVGGIVTKQLIEPLGLDQLLLVSAAVLFVSLMVTNVVDAREHRRKSELADEEARKEEEPLSKDGAFKLVMATRYLLLIALLMMILNWVNTNGEYILGETISEVARGEVSEQLGPGAEPAQVDEMVGERIGAFYAGFFTVVNILGMVIQLFLVSRILKYLGVRIALLILPCIALGGYTLLAVVPVLGVIRWAKTAENATDYSLQNTVRQALFLPTSREEKYKAKQAIDTFFWRAGDVLSALAVYVGVNWLKLPTKGFAAFNIVLVLIWIFLAISVGRENKRLTESSG